MRFVAFIRGLNVADKNVLSMRDLKKLLRNFNFTNINSILTNGNIVLDNVEHPRNTMANTITGAITDCYGYYTDVQIYNQYELEKVLLENPFLKEEGIDKNHLYITFLNDTPAPHRMKCLAEVRTKNRYHIIDNIVYLHIKSRYFKSKLNNRVIEKHLGLLGVTRSLKIIEKLLKMVTVEEPT